MTPDVICRNCRFWSRLRAGALIGRCGNDESRHQFPRSSDCCGLWMPSLKPPEMPDASELPPRPPGRPRKLPLRPI